MRIAPLALLLLTLPSTLVSQQRIDRRFAVGPAASIRIFNLAGSTRVTGWDRDTVAVTGTVPKGAGQFFAGGSGSAAKLGVFSDSIDAPGATLEVRVPRGASVWIKSATAAVTVSGVEGALDISSVSGNIAVEGAPRRLTTEAMDGNIDLVTRAPFTRAKTAGGTITLRGGGGDVLASSVSGSIRYLGAHKVLTGRLESVTGPVQFDGTVMRGGTLSIETHDGSIALALPADQLADFDVTTFGGSITNALRHEPATMPKGKAMRFSTGPDGAAITVRSFKGNVTISSP